MESPKQLSGFVARYQQQTILACDLTYVSAARSDLLDLTCRHGQLNVVEILIAGYDEDPRSLYEVVEVRAWFQSIQQQWPDWLFWLTPQSLWTSLLSLNPGMFQRLPDGRLQILMDPDAVLPQTVAAYQAAVPALLEAGVPEGSIMGLVEQARENVVDMFAQKRLGDYVVVHPDKGTIITLTEP